MPRRKGKAEDVKMIDMHRIKKWLFKHGLYHWSEEETTIATIILNKGRKTGWGVNP